MPRAGAGRNLGTGVAPFFWALESSEKGVYEMALAERVVVAANEIEQQLGLEYIVRRLMELPGQIRMQQDAVAAAKQAVEQAKGELELAEAILTVEISEAKDPRTGKALFSNAEARKAELAKRMATSQEYQAAAQTLAAAEEAHRSAQFDLDLLVNEFSAIRNVAALQARRLEIIAGKVA